jgi:hypothetical protein
MMFFQESDLWEVEKGICKESLAIGVMGWSNKTKTNKNFTVVGNGFEKSR